ncbi:hypothetical protein EJB05_01129, partial [Eragrostis curvula]
MGNNGGRADVNDFIVVDKTRRGPLQPKISGDPQPPPLPFPSLPYLSLFLELHDDHGGGGEGNGNDDPVEFTFTVLDPSGNPVPEYSRSKEEFFFTGSSASSRGFPNFIRWKDLEASGCLKDDKFTVRCDIAGTDVTVYVGAGGEQTAHNAHGWLLAARSPVFEAEVLAAVKEKVPGGVVWRHVEIQGVEPKVFKAMLHYVYTDTLPPEMMMAEEKKAVAMAQGFLAAAHKYKLERLRLMCEEMLCERVNMDTVAGSLAMAKQHGCETLEAMCVEFISRPGNLKAVIETEGFEKIKTSRPELLIEPLMKRFA